MNVYARKWVNYTTGEILYMHMPADGIDRVHARAELAWDFLHNSALSPHSEWISEPCKIGEDLCNDWIVVG